MKLLRLSGECHSRPQSPPSFWPAAGIESSGWVPNQPELNHGLPVLLRKLRLIVVCNQMIEPLHDGFIQKPKPRAASFVGARTYCARVRFTDFRAKEQSK